MTLFTLLEHAAAKHGHRTAIEFHDARLSYRELLESSERVAGLLASLGVRPGVRVAFCFHKGIDALVALFGIIRTGAAYVPLDPAWPDQRQAAICRDAGIEIWVGSKPTRLETIRTAIVSSADDDAGAVALDSANACTAPDTPPELPHDGVANVLYTSGSTGQPKGVRITTLSLMHFSRWAVDLFGLTADDRVANHAPFHFDLSTLDIFAAVRAGATMLPVPERVKVLPFQTAKFISDRRVTTWYSVPSALILMRSALARQDLAGLRHVIFAGEVMPKSELQALARELPHVTLTNLYGPTETNVCTCHPVSSEDLADSDELPIGRPIDDTRVWILDEQLQPIDTGARGELLVAGPTVSPGYLGDPERSAEKLMPAPDGQGRAYRTGDLVSRRTDGALLFHGRIDRMIKCRGYRVEPAEIEAVLARHPRVREAAVIGIGTTARDQRIAAFVSTGDDPAPAEADLLSFCREHLPTYMLPEEWRFRDALPRTDRGKVDLQVLSGELAGSTGET